jgi:small subunit ribosomal protein S2
VIPGNDDALRAVRLFASRIADAVLEGQQMLTEGGASAEEPPATEPTEVATPASVPESPVDSQITDSITPAELKAPEEEPISAVAAEPVAPKETENENAEVVAAT